MFRFGSFNRRLEGSVDLFGGDEWEKCLCARKNISFKNVFCIEGCLFSCMARYCALMYWKRSW